MVSEEFVRNLPKAELHLHIEGTLEPEQMFELARRNAISIPFASAADVRRAYEFEDLQSFLDIYYAGASVLIHERDFFEMTLAYLHRARSDGVRHAEIFFDPQTHTARGVPFETVVRGIDSALDEGRSRFGITTRLILCFLRHLSEDEAMKTLEEAIPFKDRITAVGLDSSEKGHPPSKFERVFARAREAGFLAVAHAGEEGPPGYICEALDLLHVARIDHGVRCLEDPDLVATLVARRIPLTVCPLSNVKLRVFDRLEDHNLKALLDRGVVVTINSDDPAYFGGYIAQNYIAIQRALGLSIGELRTIAKNSFEASFLGEREKRALLDEVDRYCGESSER